VNQFLPSLFQVGRILVRSQVQQFVDMKGPEFTVFAIFTALFSVSAFAAPGTVPPRSGGPQRVVTLTPALGEVVAALENGKADRLVGVSATTDFPEALKGVPSVGPYDQLSLERIVALKPDLVLASRAGNSKQQIERLQGLGLRVEVISTTDFKSTQESFRLVGNLLGRKSQGIALAEHFREELDQTRDLFKKPPTSLVLVVGDRPLVVVGGGSFLGEAVRHLGLKNPYDSAPSEYPRPSEEDLFIQNPNWLVILAMGPDLAFFDTLMNRWKSFKRLRAVESGRFGVLQLDEIMRPTPRLPRGILKLAKWMEAKEAKPSSLERTR
jgi:ABC-type Fe3+-hydroxamate transport system substrate-binding protein